MCFCRHILNFARRHKKMLSRPGSRTKIDLEWIRPKKLNRGWHTVFVPLRLISREMAWRRSSLHTPKIPVWAWITASSVLAYWLEITFPKFLIMVIGSHDFSWLKTFSADHKQFLADHWLVIGCYFKPLPTVYHNKNNQKTTKLFLIQFVLELP
jgi:hypothetical protein